MVPTDKQKAKARQASLLEQSEDKPDSIDKVVAQAFDSDPKVRLRVAEELGKVDDPRAIFALIELSSDKEEAVKDMARRSLGTFKGEEEAIVSLEKLLAERKEIRKDVGRQPQESGSEARQMMAPTIERLFSHYEPKKRESVKRKLFPSLQKFFGFREQEIDPLRGLEHIEHPVQSAPPPQQAASMAQQREKEEIPRENATNFPFGQKKEGAPKPDYSVSAEREDLVEIGEHPHKMVGEESEEFEEDKEDEESGEHESQEDEQLSQNKYFSLAYKIATTPGMGKAELKRECGRIISNFKKDIEMAFKMAEDKAKEEGFATLTNLKPGMKNLSFAEMQVVSVSTVGYGARRKPFSKLVISDGRKEVPVLMPPERAAGISQTDKLALKGVLVDFLVESNEVVLVVKNKSKVILVK